MTKFVNRENIYRAECLIVLFGPLVFIFFFFNFLSILKRKRCKIRSHMQLASIWIQFAEPTYLFYLFTSVFLRVFVSFLFFPSFVNRLIWNCRRSFLLASRFCSHFAHRLSAVLLLLYCFAAKGTGARNDKKKKKKKLVRESLAPKKRRKPEGCDSVNGPAPTPRYRQWFAFTSRG